jgi:AcrR family transcriptional regulator
MSEHGYDGFTLADVAEVAGYSRGLPAHYFGLKEDLLSQVAEYLVAEYSDRMDKLPKAAPGLAQVAVLMRNYTISQTVEGRAFSMLLAASMVRPTLRRTMTRLTTRALSNIENMILGGVQAGTIQPDTNVKAQASIIYSFIRAQASFVMLIPDFDRAAVVEEFLQTLHGRMAV